MSVLRVTLASRRSRRWSRSPVAPLSLLIIVFQSVSPSRAGSGYKPGVSFVPWVTSLARGFRPRVWSYDSIALEVGCGLHCLQFGRQPVGCPELGSEAGRQPAMATTGSPLSAWDSVEAYRASAMDSRCSSCQAVTAAMATPGGRLGGFPGQ